MYANKLTTKSIFLFTSSSSAFCLFAFFRRLTHTRHSMVDAICQFALLRRQIRPLPAHQSQSRRAPCTSADDANPEYPWLASNSNSSDEKLEKFPPCEEETFLFCREKGKSFPFFMFFILDERHEKTIT